VGLHALQILLPTHELAVNFTQISHEECIFLSRLAHISIDALHALFHGIANQFASIVCVIFDSQSFLTINLGQGLDTQWRVDVFFEIVNSGRCHNQVCLYPESISG